MEKKSGKALKALLYLVLTFSMAFCCGSTVWLCNTKKLHEHENEVIRNVLRQRGRADPAVRERLAEQQKMLRKERLMKLLKTSKYGKKKGD
jgi:predicted GIY-YIG superfamily endonuclease